MAPADLWPKDGIERRSRSTPPRTRGGLACSASFAPARSTPTCWLSLALFVALGGTSAYAANTVGSSDIIDGEVKSVDIGNGEIKSADVKDQSLTTFDVSTFLGADIVDGSLTGADISDNSIGVATSARSRSAATKSRTTRCSSRTSGPGR